MFWISVGLFCLGVACGATVRLMIFVGVLFGAAVIAAVVMMDRGLSAALLSMLVTVLVLQFGYAAGVVLRAAARSLFAGASETGPAKRAVTDPFGEKR